MNDLTNLLAAHSSFTANVGELLERECITSGDLFVLGDALGLLGRQQDETAIDAMTHAFARRLTAESEVTMRLRWHLLAKIADEANGTVLEDLDRAYDKLTGADGKPRAVAQ